MACNLIGADLQHGELATHCMRNHSRLQDPGCRAVSAWGCPATWRLGRSSAASQVGCFTAVRNPACCLLLRCTPCPVHHGRRACSHATCHMNLPASCRCRDLQPPSALASAWPEQRERMLHEVAAVLGSGAGASAASGRSSSTSAAAGPTAEPARTPQDTENTKISGSDEAAESLQRPAAATDHPAAKPD